MFFRYLTWSYLPDYWGYAASLFFPRLHFTPSYSNVSTAFHPSQAVHRGGEMRVWGQFITAALCYSLLLTLSPLDMGCSHCCNNSGYTSSSRSSPWAAFREYPLVLLCAAAPISSLSWCSPHKVLHCGLYMVCKGISAEVSGAPPFPSPPSLLPESVGVSQMFFYHSFSAFLPLTIFFTEAVWVDFGQFQSVAETFVSCCRKPLASSHRGHPSCPQNFDMYT